MSMKFRLEAEARGMAKKNELEIELLELRIAEHRDKAKMSEITRGTYHNVEVAETQYIRFSADNWMQWMGHSLEYPFFEVTYLEEQFQNQLKLKDVREQGE